MTTYLIFGGLFLATSAIVINSWRNARATTNVSHVIHEAETARKDS